MAHAKVPVKVLGKDDSRNGILVHSKLHKRN